MEPGENALPRLENISVTDVSSLIPASIWFRRKDVMWTIQIRSKQRKENRLPSESAVNIALSGTLLRRG